MNFWKFKYVSIFLVWKKLNKSNSETKIGLGYYSRNSYEFLLIGTRGKIGKYRRF